MSRDLRKPEAHRSRLTVQFVWLFFSRGTAVVLQAGLLILVGRAVGPADFGAIGVITAVCTIVGSLSDFGIATYISKNHAVGDRDAITTALLLNVLTTWGTGIVLSGALLAVFWTWTYAWAVIPIAVAFALEKNTDTALNVPIADARNGVPLASLLIRRCAAVAAYLLLAFAFGIDAVWAYSAAIVVGAIAGQLHIRLVVTRGFKHERGGSSVTFREVFRVSFPYLVTNLSAQARSLDIVFASALLGSVAAGLYSAATRLTRPFLLIPQTMATVILPHATRRDGRNARAVAIRLALMAALSLVIVVPLAVFAEPIVNLVMGSAFDDASPAFAVSMVSLPFVALPPPLGALLQSQGRATFVSVNGVVFAVLTIAAVVVGALAWGIVGIAGAIGVVYAAKALTLLMKIRTLPDSIAIVPEAVVTG